MHEADDPGRSKVDDDVAAASKDSGSSGASTEVPPPRIRRILVTVALLAGCYLYWRAMLQWFFPQRDDFWLISITDDPYGQFDAGEFLWRWWHDWAHRNGRSSDAFVRALLRGGVSAVGWLAPAILTACSAAAWRWLPRTSASRKGASAPAALMILTAIPVALLANTSISGSTVFWAAGIGNYVVPTGLAVLATSWLLRPPSSRGIIVLAAASILLAGALHEVAALTVFAVTTVWWLLNRNAVTSQHSVLIVTSYVATVLGFAGPGRWRRLGDLVGDESGLGGWISSAARFISEALLQTTTIWVAVLAVLSLSVVVMWRSSSVLERRWLAGAMTLAWVAGGASWALARSWRSGPERCSQVVPLGDGNAAAAIVMVITAGLTVCAVAVVLVRLRTRLGDAPVLLGTGLLATLPIPMATGLCAPRVWYPPLVWALTLVGVLIATLQTRRLVHRGVLVTASVVSVVLALCFALAAYPALQANHASFAGVVEQVSDTQHTGTGTVRFPEDVPYPEYGHRPVYRLASIACGFRTYYEVPDEVILDDGTAPDAGLPDYCPRPDDPRQH